MDDGTGGRPVAGANERALGGFLMRGSGALLFALLGACAGAPPANVTPASVALTGAPGQFPWSPGDSPPRFAGLTLGMTIVEARRVLGEPDSVRFGFGGGESVDQWVKLGVHTAVLAKGAGEIQGIFVLKRGTGDLAGVRVGDRCDQLRRQWGDPSLVEGAITAWWAGSWGATVECAGARGQESITWIGLRYAPRAAIAEVAPTRGDSLLLGRWESASASRGGLGQTLEFTATYQYVYRNGGNFVGRLVATVGARVDGTYRTDGERLMRRVPDAPDELVVAYTQHGDTLVLGEQRMVRLAASTSRSGIVGRWSYRHNSGATAIEEYGADGTWRFRLPFRSDTSIYETHGDTISAYAGDMAGEYRWSVSAGTLRLARFDATVPVALYNRAPERW